MATNQRRTLPLESVAWSPCHIGEGLVNGEKCSIGALAHIGRNVTLGDGCRIQGGAYIADGCVLGDGVFVGPNSTMLNDKYPPSRNADHWMPVKIESNAVIGAGVTVGENAVLAAGSTLTRDLPADEVWAGNPATLLMTRAQYEQKGGR